MRGRNKKPANHFSGNLFLLGSERLGRPGRRIDLCAREGRLRTQPHEDTGLIDKAIMRLEFEPQGPIVVHSRRTPFTHRPQPHLPFAHFTFKRHAQRPSQTSTHIEI